MLSAASLTLPYSIDFKQYARAADPKLIQNSEVLKLLREQEAGIERGGVGGGGGNRQYREQAGQIPCRPTEHYTKCGLAPTSFPLPT